MYCCCYRRHCSSGGGSLADKTKSKRLYRLGENKSFIRTLVGTLTRRRRGRERTFRQDLRIPRVIITIILCRRNPFTFYRLNRRGPGLYAFKRIAIFRKYKTISFIGSGRLNIYAVTRCARSTVSGLRRLIRDCRLRNGRVAPRTITGNCPQ